MNGFEVREFTIFFSRNDCVELFNKGLKNVVSKIMRKYSRFLPLPLCMFNNLKKITISDINEESVELFKQINDIDYDVYSKFEVYEARSGRKML